MDKAKAILEKTLKEIQPDKNYEKEIFQKLNIIIKKINQGPKGIRAILGGSGAKGTWLKTFDADIFVLFAYKKYKEKSDEISDILEAILKKKLSKIIRIHGSRDYFQIRQDNFTFEIVPILKIQKSEQAKNITDVSPLHSKWVFGHKLLVNEMKLTKQFCKARNIYGAESYIMGFSGYVCEILTVYYGSFMKLLRAASKWQDKVVIDVQKYYRGKDVFRIVNTSKLLSPLIVIDPVQKDRNAAAALSIEKFEAFKAAAKEFLMNPKEDFFVKKNLKLIFLKEKHKKLISIKTVPLAGKADVVGSKLLKIFEFLCAQLKNNDFKVLKSDWEWDKKNQASFYFLFDKNPLPKKIEVEGPPINLKNHVDNFRKIHKKTFLKNKKIYAVEERKFLLPEEILKQAIKSRCVKEKNKSIKINIL